MINTYYAAICDDSVYRVIIKEVCDKKVLVHFIDFGDDDYVPVSAIRELKHKFYALPAQALLVNLVGLECTSKLDYNEEIMDSIVGKSYVAVVELRNPYFVILFDTSSESDDKNMNTFLLQLLIERTISNTTLTINKVIEIRVSHVNNNGEVFIQLAHCPIKDVLDSRLFDLEKKQLLPARMILLNTIYLAKFEEKLQRVIICPKSDFPKQNIDVFFIDTGKTGTISVLNLFEDSDTVVKKVPFLVQKVYLKDVMPLKFDQRKINKLKEIAPPTRPIISKLVEIIQCGSEKIPVLELFIRNPADKLLSSINHSIELEDILGSYDNGNDVNENGNDDIITNIEFENLKISHGYVNDRVAVEESTVKDNSLEKDDIFIWTGKRDIFISLRAEIPDVNEKYFEIYVNEVANPSNFIVQPVRYLSELNELTKQMKTFYDDVDATVSIPLTYGVYAAQLSDGYWYRALIHQTINDYITIRLCDYWNLEVVALSSLKPLHKKFMRLPFVGFQATLAGIVPKHTDWSFDDCYRIRKLMVGKKFISIIKEIAYLKNDFILSLDIIDTSTSEDINIAHKLVLEGTAIYTT